MRGDQDDNYDDTPTTTFFSKDFGSSMKRCPCLIFVVFLVLPEQQGSEGQVEKLPASNYYVLYTSLRTAC